MTVAHSAPVTHLDQDSFGVGTAAILRASAVTEDVFVTAACAGSGVVTPLGTRPHASASATPAAATRRPTTTPIALPLDHDAREGRLRRPNLGVARPLPRLERATVA
ncbi:hypothetical protein GCM10009714_30010 [Microlunatus capsulatus]